MALTRSLSQMETRVRYICDVGGTSGTDRHPQAQIFDELNAGVAALQRILTEAVPDQRFLSSTTITMVSGTSLYSLPSTFRSLISVELTANGMKRWMSSFDLSERPQLTNPGTSYSGVPSQYRLEGASIEFLPIPSAAYSAFVWFVPHTIELAGAATFDTIERLDDYPVWRACRAVAKRDRLWDLHDRLAQDLATLETDIRVLARNRDANVPSRVVDTMEPDRFGVRGSRMSPPRWGR